MNKDFWLVNIWKAGPYIDLWSVNHFLGGMILGYLSLIFDIRFGLALIIALLIMVGWEIYEIIRKVTETSYNKFFDIFLGLIGFLIFTLRPTSLNHYSFAVILFIFIFLELWGLSGYKARKRVK